MTVKWFEILSSNISLSSFRIVYNFYNWIINSKHKRECLFGSKNCARCPYRKKVPNGRKKLRWTLLRLKGQKAAKRLKTPNNLITPIKSAPYKKRKNQDVKIQKNIILTCKRQANHQFAVWNTQHMSFLKLLLSFWANLTWKNFTT